MYRMNCGFLHPIKRKYKWRKQTLWYTYQSCSSSTSTGRIMWQIFCGSCCWLCGFLFGVILLSKKNGKRLSSSTPKQSNLVGKMQHITVIGLLHTWNRGECEDLSKKRDCKGDAWRLQGSN